jgi:hypothetical protein
MRITSYDLFSPIYPDTVGAQFQVGHIHKGVKILDFGDPVTDKIEIGDVGQGFQVLDVLDFVEREIQAGELSQMR